VTRRQALEQVAQALLSGLRVPAACPQPVEHRALLIDSPPQGVPFIFERQPHLIHVRRVTRARALATVLIGVWLAFTDVVDW
jgi:hypothetical protein